MGADFNVLGIQFRGYFDFGVALQDYRGGVKLKGEDISGLPERFLTEVAAPFRS